MLDDLLKKAIQRQVDLIESGITIDYVRVTSVIVPSQIKDKRLKLAEEKAKREAEKAKKEAEQRKLAEEKQKHDDERKKKLAEAEKKKEIDRTLREAEEQKLAERLRADQIARMQQTAPETKSRQEVSRQGSPTPIGDDMLAATRRWIAHVRDPDDVETYRVLQHHARLGFIANHPPARFLASQVLLPLQHVTTTRARARVSAM